MTDFSRVMARYDGVLPVPVFDVLTDLGLGPSFQELDDEVSGWIELQKNGEYHVVINERHPLTRKRFTAAHELGHYIYHRDLLGQGTGDTRAYRAAESPLPNSAIRPRHERQANSFAANFLMPSDTVTALKLQGNLTNDEMAEMLGVSQEALKIRLGSTE